MISDVLYEALTTIDEYLADPITGAHYTGPMRARILACRAEMDAIQAEIWAGFTAPPTTEALEGPGEA